MKVLTTEIPGVLILEPKVFGDDRGFRDEAAVSGDENFRLAAERRDRSGRDDEHVDVFLHIETCIGEEAIALAIAAHLVGVHEEQRGKRARTKVADANAQATCVPMPGA